MVTERAFWERSILERVSKTSESDDRTTWTNPCLRLHVQFLYISVFEKAGEANSVVCKMRLLSNDNNIVLSSLCIEFQELFAGIYRQTGRDFIFGERTHTKIIPTIPSPTTTTFFLCEPSRLISPLTVMISLMSRRTKKRMSYQLWAQMDISERELIGKFKVEGHLRHRRK